MNPQRHNQIEKALHILDKSSTVDILGSDQHLLFLFKKSERIVSALYVITGLFSDMEPLKWGIRESGTLLLKHILSIRNRGMSHSEEILSDQATEVAHLLSLLDLAYISNLISPMNFAVLKKELEVTRVSMEGKWHLENVSTAPPSFNEHFFGIDKGLFPGTRQEKGELTMDSSYTATDGGQHEKLQSFSEFERFKREQKDLDKGHSIKDTVLNRRLETSHRSNHKTHLHSGVSGVTLNQTKQDRTKQIISVLREKKVAMIKDFSSVIDGCSEKTVQRLLIEMVQGGVLKREGDRRWSRYSLV